MATIKVHGGDFVAGQSGTFRFGVLTLPTPSRYFFLVGSEKIPLSKVMRVEAVNKEERHRTGAAVGRGAVAAMIAGPIGSIFTVLGGPTGTAVALASGIIGYNTTNHSSDVTFEAEFEGGQRLLATTDTATYTKLLGAAFDYKPPSAVTNQDDEPPADAEPENPALAEIRSAIATERGELVRSQGSYRPVDRGGPLPKTTMILGALLVFVVAGMINGAPLAWGIVVAAFVLIVGSKVIRRLDRESHQSGARTIKPKTLEGSIIRFWDKNVSTRKAARVLAACAVFGVFVGIGQSEHPAQQVAKSEAPKNPPQPYVERPAMSQAAWDQFVGDANRSHNNAMAARDYADATRNEVRRLEERLKELKRR